MALPFPRSSGFSRSPQLYSGDRSCTEVGRSWPLERAKFRTVPGARCRGHWSGGPGRPGARPRPSAPARARTQLYGKSLLVAAESAQLPYSPGASGVRAPPVSRRSDVRRSVSAPAVRALGVRARRLASRLAAARLFCV